MKFRRPNFRTLDSLSTTAISQSIVYVVMKIRLPESDLGLMGALAEIKLRSLINSQRNPIQR